MIYIIGQVHWTLQGAGVCYIVSKCHELWSTNGLKLDRNFYPELAPKNWTKQNIHNIAQGRRNVQGVTYSVLKFHELWSTNGLKLEHSFYPPSVFCFVPGPSMAHAVSGINMAPHGESNGIGFVCSSHSKLQKDLHLVMASHRQP